MISRGYFLLILGTLLITTMIFKSSKNNYCTYLIVLGNKKEITAKDLNWYKSGFVNIRKCDGKSITYVENFIDTVMIKN